MSSCPRSGILTCTTYVKNPITYNEFVQSVPPSALHSFIFCQASEVKYNVVHGSAFWKGIGFLLAKRKAGMNARFR